MARATPGVRAASVAGHRKILRPGRVYDSAGHFAQANLPGSPVSRISPSAIPLRAAPAGTMPKTLSRSYVELKRGVNENYQAGGISGTHLLLGRPAIQSTTTGSQTITTEALRAGVTAGTGHTKSTVTIPRHAQRLFLPDHQPAKFPQPPATIPTTQAAARWSKRTTEMAQSILQLGPSRTVRRYQANGYPIATNAFSFIARPSLEQS